MFTQAVRRSNKTGMTINPCRGMDKAHETDPNANREWHPEEWTISVERAPMEIKIAMMLARYAGLRGQTIVVAGWKQYRDHDLTGKCFRFVAGKNKENGFVPAITRVSHYLRDLERDGLIGSGTTLHGLRVTYAAWLKRHGANDSEVAAGLGDKSPRMGAHYIGTSKTRPMWSAPFKRVKDAT
jgi:integrase